MQKLGNYLYTHCFLSNTNSNRGLPMTHICQQRSSLWPRQCTSDLPICNGDWLQRDLHKPWVRELQERSSSGKLEHLQHVLQSLASHAIAVRSGSAPLASVLASAAHRLPISPERYSKTIYYWMMGLIDILIRSLIG